MKGFKYKRQPIIERESFKVFKYLLRESAAQQRRKLVEQSNFHLWIFHEKELQKMNVIICPISIRIEDKYFCKKSIPADTQLLSKAKQKYSNELIFMA